MWREYLAQTNVAAYRLANQRSALLGPNEVVALAAERYLQTEAVALVAVAKAWAEWPPWAAGRLRRTPRSLGLPRPHDWANTYALRRHFDLWWRARCGRADASTASATRREQCAPPELAVAIAVGAAATLGHMLVAVTELSPTGSPRALFACTRYSAIAARHPLGLTAPCAGIPTAVGARTRLRRVLRGAASSDARGASSRNRGGGRRRAAADPRCTRRCCTPPLSEAAGARSTRPFRARCQGTPRLRLLRGRDLQHS